MFIVIEFRLKRSRLEHGSTYVTLEARAPSLPLKGLFKTAPVEAGGELTAVFDKEIELNKEDIVFGTVAA